MAAVTTFPPVSGVDTDNYYNKTEVELLIASGGGGGGGIALAQTTGSGTDVIMSQKAVSDRIQYTNSTPMPTAVGGAKAGTTLWAGITGKPETATRWPTFDEVTGKPATFTPTVHTHPVSQVTGLGTASAMDVGTAAGNVMAVGAFGLGHSFPYEAFDANLIADQVGSKSGFYPYMSNSGTNLPYDYVYIYQVFLNDERGNVTQIAYGYITPEIWIRYRYNNVWSPWAKNYNTFNTTKNPDGTLKASSPVINLYTDKHDLHNELEFGATPVVTRKSKGVYEITGTLGLRSEGWYVDTPNDRNGNKYFNIEWTQNITPDAVDGVVDEYRDDIVVTIETFERVWNKDTGMFDNGNPIDINDLQNRFVQLRFNEIKVGQEITND